MNLKEKITLYQVLEMLDKIFTPNTTEFSDYVKWTSDDNGFLRTCFCKKSKQLENRKIPKDCIYIIVSFDKPFNQNNLICSWTDEPFEFEETITKMQISFDVSKDSIESDIEWNFGMGYMHCYVIDLATETIISERDKQ